ncbi:MULTISPECIES: DUF1493 family protein [Cyanophyceae]|uniref:DUF1493 family protein n=1 Tax=Cyanophyceae TaxID=3028117 RepID=UPI00016DCC6A|nr:MULTISPECIES: DUF1493 family protein [Cyanophyceae]ACA99756.1 conserved hypothetical protein [Picosynechococcus sp. PCC 7002]SMH56184.1 Protein of unknown function [Picosynechococcus sp. OG1]SMQ83377.1 Protein of unknown function [Synechococcus sp. 7002]
MATSTLTDIYRFIQQEIPSATGDRLNATTDLFGTFDIQADDCATFIEKFAQKFKVDLDGYLWYFHHGEAGLNLGGFLIKPPYERVERIPITPEILLKAATKRRWKLSYPDHTLPKKRWDMVVNKIILFLVFFYILNRFAPLLIEKFT